MSASEHLHPEQFKGYKPAAEESKAAVDWLASDAGHFWQDRYRDRSDSVYTRRIGGFYRLKNDLHPMALADKDVQYRWKPGERHL